MLSGLYNNTNSSQTNSQNVLPEQSRENVTILSPQTNLQFDKSEVDSVLSDFERLDFKDNKCFDKIADDYNKKGKSSLFNYVIEKR
ncbi:hypothetical protein [Wolbachia endosymbiont of Atemnus politus]|uniref:hypothetical protein n=1 Tax=Wolbachia endosymbiont of Atemnus politus TaxID=2682840 RepID=UPI001FE4C39E|nr:hypothetical protein [Wolbachia endosymbiont of Atemnus politus]